MTATGVPVEVVARSSAGLTVTTPCGGTTVLGALTALGEVQVVLDPGHGGPVDTGALGPNGLTEAALNLRVAEAVRSQLEQRGLSAMLTRTGDYALPLSVRASLADAAGAAVFVSLHHNAPRSAPSPVPGTEVFVQSTSTESSRLGTLLYDHVTAALSQFDVAWTRRHDAGVLRVTLPDGSDAYGVVRRPATTTALVELGYLANPSEAQLFATDTYVEAAGAAVAAAIADFVAGEASSPAPTGQRTMTPGRAQGGHDCVDPPLG